MASIALVGAGGKMGLRITDNLRKTHHDVRQGVTEAAAREFLLGHFNVENAMVLAITRLMRRTILQVTPC